MKENRIMKYFLLLIVLVLQSYQLYSQWVVKARFGLGSQDLYGAQTRYIGSRITRDQNPIYLDKGVTVSPVRRLPYGEVTNINYHFGAEASLNKKIWFGFNANFNSMVGVGQIYRMYGPAQQANYYGPDVDADFDFTQEGYYEESKYSGSIVVRRYQLLAGYYFLNSSHFTKAAKGSSKNKPLFEIGAFGGLSLIHVKTKDMYGTIPIFGPTESILYDGTPIKMHTYYGAIRRYNIGLSGGVNFKLNVPGKHEIFTFSFWYEEQFKDMVRSLSVVDIGGVGYVNDYYAKGSHWGFKFSFPVFSYNFTKKKFYRD